jgi:hypothetical protein
VCVLQPLHRLLLPLSQLQARRHQGTGDALSVLPSVRGAGGSRRRGERVSAGGGSMGGAGQAAHLRLSQRTLRNSKALELQHRGVVRVQRACGRNRRGIGLSVRFQKPCNATLPSQDR